jgi:hypothetical protein
MGGVEWSAPRFFRHLPCWTWEVEFAAPCGAVNNLKFSVIWLPAVLAPELKFPVLDSTVSNCSDLILAQVTVVSILLLPYKDYSSSM